jgi:hypothetical protein
MADDRRRCPPEIIAIQRRDRAASCASKVPLNYAMSPEYGVVDDGRPGLIHLPPIEIAAFGFHEQWNAMMERE